MKSPLCTTKLPPWLVSLFLLVAVSRVTAQQSAELLRVTVNWYVCVCVCVCVCHTYQPSIDSQAKIYLQVGRYGVCVCVSGYSCTPGFLAAYESYKELLCYKW